jgi:pyruvate kinase
VFVKGQIFESMLTCRIPTCSEVNDIISLVNDEVDGVVVVRETMYSKNAFECIDGIC